jgi:hypothetical protein
MIPSDDSNADCHFGRTRTRNVDWGAPAAPGPAAACIRLERVKSMVIRPVEFWFSYSDSLCIRAAKLNALIVNAARGGLNRRRMDNIAAERSPTWLTAAPPINRWGIVSKGARHPAETPATTSCGRLYGRRRSR